MVLSHKKLWRTRTICTYPNPSSNPYPNPHLNRTQPTRTKPNQISPDTIQLPHPTPASPLFPPQRTPSVDHDFPADQSSLGSDKECAWVRAPHLLTTPRLFSDNLEPNDIMQGALGDCWLMTAIAGLAEFPRVVEVRSCRIGVRCGARVVSELSPRFYDPHTCTFPLSPRPPPPPLLRPPGVCD